MDANLIILLRQMPRESKCVTNTETITSREFRWSRRNVRQVNQATSETGNAPPEDPINENTLRDHRAGYFYSLLFPCYSWKAQACPQGSIKLKGRDITVFMRVGQGHISSSTKVFKIFLHLPVIRLSFFSFCCTFSISSFLLNSEITAKSPKWRTEDNTKQKAVSG